VQIWQYFLMQVDFCMDTLTPFTVGQYITIVNNCISAYFVEDSNRAANKPSLTAKQSHTEPLKY